MPDYAGAKAAMRARFVDGWAARTPIAFQNERPPGWNETPPKPWPPVNDDKELLPWVLFEVIGSGAELAGSGGQPGNRLWRYEGEINVHVFVPVGSADADATGLALAAGELFRAASFYEGTGGRRVRTLTPSIDDISTGDDEGTTVRCSMSVDFTYWHRG